MSDKVKITIELSRKVLEWLKNVYGAKRGMSAEEAAVHMIEFEYEGWKTIRRSIFTGKIINCRFSA